MRRFSGVSIFCLIVGVGLILHSSWHIIKTNQFLSTAVRTTGIAENHYERTGPMMTSHSMNRPSVRFNAPDGRIGTYEGKMLTSEVILQTGDKVTVFYDPKDLSRTEIGKFQYLWLMPIAILVLGIVIAGLVLFVAYYPEIAKKYDFKIKE